MFTLHNGDCLQVMPTIPSGSIDAIITDLPYGTTACKWDTIIPFEPMWKEVKRVLKPNGAFITTSCQPFTSALVMSNPSMFKVEWVWVKNRVTGFASVKYKPMNGHENILVFGKGRITYNPIFEETISEITKAFAKNGTKRRQKRGNSPHSFGLKDQITDFKEMVYPKTYQFFDCVPLKRGTLHPSQKPIELYEYLIKTYTNDGETILDIAMGSGTTIEAARRNNRNAIGIEKDKHYFEVAERRLNNGLL